VKQTSLSNVFYRIFAARILGIQSFLFFRYKIEISGGLGPTVGKILRVGLMGVNAQISIVDRVLSALHDGLQHALKAKM